MDAAVSRALADLLRAGRLEQFLVHVVSELDEKSYRMYDKYVHHVGRRNSEWVTGKNGKIVKLKEIDNELLEQWVAQKVTNAHQQYARLFEMELNFRYHLGTYTGSPNGIGFDIKSFKENPDVKIEIASQTKGWGILDV